MINVKVFYYIRVTVLNVCKISFGDDFETAGEPFLMSLSRGAK